MALYHFTVKNDSRPAYHKGEQKKGTRIRAALHSDYINRQGQYKEQDAKDADRLENLITSEKTPDAFYGLTTLMYASPYGHIYNTERGVALTDRPSDDTVAIALMVAQQTMQAPLVIKGSERFKARCIQVACDANLPVTFADSAMQDILLEQKEKKENEQREFRKQGGRITGGIQNLRQPDVDYRRKRLPKITAQGTLSSVRKLSAGFVDAVQPQQPAVLLHAHAGGELGYGRAESDPSLRRYIRGRGQGTAGDGGNADRSGGRGAAADGTSGGTASGTVRNDFRTGRRARAGRTARALMDALAQKANEAPPAQSGQVMSPPYPNTILAASQPPLAGGFPATLITGTQGTVVNTFKGLSVSSDATLDTLSISLMMASREKPDTPLEVTGSLDFKASCVLAATFADLPITFADPAMQDELDKRKKEDAEEREQYLRDGGQIVTYHAQEPPKIPQPQDKTLSAVDKLSSIKPLSEISVLRENDDEERAEALRWIIEDDMRRKVRPDFTAGRRRRATETSAAILDTLRENIDDVRASKHVEYINRHRAFEKKGGCVYQKHRLPPWAKDDPFVFFSAADRYSKKARRYKEFEFALQNELTLEQNLEIIDEFIKENLPNHYYAYAVHDKIGTISGTSHNLHVHLMVSPKIIDDIEREKPRGKEAYFSEPIRRDSKEYGDRKARRRRGAEVDRKFSEKWFIPQARKSYAEITNRVLEKYGHRARVDHRSLKAQKLEAEMNGDKVLAAILDRIPETHIAQMAMLEESNPRVENVRIYRSKKNKHRDLLFEADRMKRRLEETERQEKSDELNGAIHQMVESGAYLAGDNDQTSYIGTLRQNFAEALQEYETCKSMLTSTDDAYNDAKREYMTEEEEEAYDDYLYMQKELAHWQEFKDNVTRPKSMTGKERAAYDDLDVALDEKITRIQQNLKATEPAIQQIEEKLDVPDIKKQIQLIANRELQANKHQQMTFYKAEDNLVLAITALEQALSLDETQTRLQDSFSVGELYAIARRRYYGYKKEAMRLEQKIERLKKQVISPERARAMAEDIYTKKGFSSLRKEERDLKKTEEYLAQKKADYERFRAGFMEMSPEASPEEYEKTRRILEGLRQDIERKEADVLATRQALTVKRQDLEKTVTLPYAQKKIYSIALGILRSHGKVQKQYDAAVKQLDAVNRKLTVAQAQMNAMQKAYEQDKAGRYRYRVEKDRAGFKDRPMPKDFDKPGFIMQAIMGDEPAAKAVGRMDNGDESTSKIWSLMSELAKEEEYNKNFAKDM